MNDQSSRDNTKQEIVVVDDSLNSLRLMTEILQRHGYRVRPVSSPLLALETVAAKLPDLILLDVKMPDMDGYEVCRRLKSDEQSRNIPVIFVSGFGETAKKVEGFKAGGVDYITKPLEAEEVVARVGTHLRMRELTESLEQIVRERTEELTKANQHLRKANRAYKALIDCNQALIRATDEKELLNEVCRIIREDCGYHLVWVGYTEHKDSKMVRPVAQSGYEEKYFDTINITWADGKPGLNPTGIAVREKRPVITKDFLTNPDSAPWRDEAIQRGYASSAALPLLTSNREVIGILNVYASEKDAFSKEETNLLMELAGDLAYGIISWRTRDERKRAEAELAQSEERYRILVETMNDGLGVQDENGRITYINNRLCEMWGYSRDELIGRPVTDFLDEANRTILEAQMKSQLKGKDSPYELTWTGKDGRKIDTIMSPKGIFDEGGNPRGSFAVITDISERKRAEEALSWEAEVNLSAAELSRVLLSPAAIDDISYLVLEHAKRLTRSTFGYVGHIDPETGHLVCPTLTRDIWDTCQVAGKDIVFKKFTGLWGWVLKNRRPLLTNAASDDPRSSGTPPGHVPVHNFLSAPALIRGKLVGQVSVANSDNGYTEYDRSVIERLANLYAIALQRKQSEEELHRLRNLLSNIVNSMPSVLVGVDMDGNITQWNQEAEKATGVKADDAHGQFLSDVFPGLAGEMEKVHRAIKERTTLREEKVSYTINNEMRYNDVTVYPLVTNHVEGAVIRIDDVTERVRIEEMMIQTEKMMSVGVLAAGMAHEINNPLAAVIQNVQVVLMRTSKDLPANRQAALECDTNMETVYNYMQKRDIIEILENVNTSGKRAAQIVKNMLSFSRKSEASFLPHVLSDLLDNAVSLASSDYSLKNKYDFRMIEIKREYDKNLPEVVCEETKIQQVILNLLMNAAEAMAGHKAPQIILRTHRDGEMVCIEVEDNGPGMDEEERKHAFEPFFTTKDVGKGTGLGLSVSYFIITEHHGGMMSVESEPGQGAKFIIRLPFGT